MLICLSASHKNSSFDLLEKLSGGSDHVTEKIVHGHEAVSGAVVVATCNRFEAYIDLDQPEGESPLPALMSSLAAIGDATGVDAEELRGSLDLAHAGAVVSHLFAVSSGLESVVVGEGEIAGQVRRALERARAAGTTTPELERLFQRASQTSRAVKNRTGIGSAGRSLVRLALDLAGSRVRDWADARVLLVGTGRYAGATLAALRDRGANNVRVYSPSGRAKRFAASHNIAAVSAEEYAREAGQADIIITCTTATEHVLNAAVLNSQPGTASTLVVDLGLPRNVDPDVATVDGVQLLDLETIRLHAPLEELNSADEAREVVKSAARAYGIAAEENQLAPAVVALRAHVFDILEAEIERSRGRAGHSVHTEEALRHLVGVLLHTPMVRSRQYARQGDHRDWIAGVEAVFGVRPASCPALSPEVDIRAS